MERFLECILSSWKRSLLAGAVVFLITLITAFVIPPAAFPRGQAVVIPEGISVRAAGEALELARVVRSSSFLILLVQLFGSENGVKAGTYAFEHPLSSIEVARRIITGNTGLPLVKVTIPEGSSVRDIARILSGSLSSFDMKRFIELATEDEGYLFPETYLFTDGVPPETVRAVMRAEFEKNIFEISDDIERYVRPLEDVVVMASLLEKEARLFETKRIIAGILWKRLARDIPLQTDAVFGYIFGTTTFSPTFDQLEVDSPYNTYRNLGLPPGPIANPGLESLKAAVNPEETPYFYYLTGADGVMHYARTFEEHVSNRRYLR